MKRSCKRISVIRSIKLIHFLNFEKILNNSNNYEKDGGSTSGSSLDDKDILLHHNDAIYANVYPGPNNMPPQYDEEEEDEEASALRAELLALQNAELGIHATHDPYGYALQIHRIFFLEERANFF